LNQGRNDEARAIFQALVEEDANDDVASTARLALATLQAAAQAVRQDPQVNRARVALHRVRASLLAFRGATGQFPPTLQTPGLERYGFSYEDMLMNTAGSVAGYLMYKYPEFARKVDLRWEYAPAFDRTDLFTDYEHTKYLLALQLSGFDRFKDTPLQFLELQLGYYSRGFETRRPDRERNIYIGVGVNLARVFEKAGCEDFCKVFHYYQPPHTYLSLDNDLND